MILIFAYFYIPLSKSVCSPLTAGSSNSRAIVQTRKWNCQIKLWQVKIKLISPVIHQLSFLPPEATGIVWYVFSGGTVWGTPPMEKCSVMGVGLETMQVFLFDSLLSSCRFTVQLLELLVALYCTCCKKKWSYLLRANVLYTFPTWPLPCLSAVTCRRSGTPKWAFGLTYFLLKGRAAVSLAFESERQLLPKW